MTGKQQSIPSPRELKQGNPLSKALSDQIEQWREIVRKILTGEDPRLLLIIGPCSIHHIEGAMAYASRVKELQEEVSDKFFLVMRTHFEKPRSKLGWKGFCYDPDLNGQYDIEAGLRQARQLLIQLTEMGVPAGTEFLDPNMTPYFSDLITWGSIGARTSTSQVHRQLASALPMPVGIKNSISGDIGVAIDGIVAASEPHIYLAVNEDAKLEKVETLGNPFCHLVLRGGNMTGPNYDSRSVAYAVNQLTEEMCIPKVLVDCSHHNSGKDHHRQPGIFMDVLEQIVAERVDSEGNSSGGIAGMIIESYLQGGHQSIIAKEGEAVWIDPTLSMTDPCLDWETTEGMIVEAAEKFQSHLLTNTRN